MTVLRILFGPASVFIIALAGLAPVCWAQTTASGQGQKEALPSPAASLTVPQKTPVTITDAEFVRRAVAVTRYQIEAGRIAADKASNAKTKDFAGTLALKNSALLNDLEKAVSEAGIAMPSDVTLDATQQRGLDALKVKGRTDFDALFKADMTKVHDDSLALLTLYLQVGKNTKLLGWASKALPTMQKHRDMLKEM